MGLDMYLRKKIYIGGKYSNNDYYINKNGHLDKIADKIIVAQGSKPVKIDFTKVTYVVEEAAYWRKANAVHKWFVDTVQEGDDNCAEYYVSREQLKSLLETCKKIQADHSLAESLLPTSGGFFFGDTDYDEYYFNGNIDRTIEQLEQLDLDDEDCNYNVDYYYQSSW